MTIRPIIDIGRLYMGVDIPAEDGRLVVMLLPAFGIVLQFRNWEQGMWRGHRARRDRLTGKIQYVLWEKGQMMPSGRLLDRDAWMTASGAQSSYFVSVGTGK